MKRVLDAHGLLVFLEREKGYKKVEQFFMEAVEKKSNLLMSCVNFGEIYYIILREQGARKVHEIEAVIHTLPIEIVDVNMAIAKEAAQFKAFKKLSYADCFSAALAKIHKAELVTGDKEFKSVENEIKIAWV